MTSNWAMNLTPRQNRNPRVRPIWAGAVICVMTLALAGCGGSDATTPQGFVGDTGDTAPTVAADIASFLGETCDGDHLVMTQGSQNNYCDKDAKGSLVWVDEDTHEENEALAQVAADKEAAVAKAAELAAEKEAAEVKAQEEADAQAKQEADALAEQETAKAAELAAAKVAADTKAQEVADAKAEQEAAELNKPATLVTKDKPQSSAYYKNCTEARAAGVTPLYEGEPGYSTKLDRDRDGVACE